MADAPVPGETVPGETVPGEPVPGEPVPGEPVAGEPVAGEPVAGEPVAGEPVAGEPVAGDQVGQEQSVGEQDALVVGEQLGRPPRGLRAVAHRCPCGWPDVVETAPRLDDGTPFPTLFYLTCPRAAAAVSRLESGGLMRDMQQRLATDRDLRAGQQAAHRDYTGRRDAAAAAAGIEPLPPGTQSAGGMPDRVKCLHALVAHELAVPGANPLGREAADAAGEWWAQGPCVPAVPAAP